MTNAQGGSRLASGVMGSIAVEYNWPDFRPTVRSSIEVARTVLARYQATGQEKLPVFPESKTKFFLKAVDAELEFFPDDKGGDSYLVLHQGGRDTKALKK